MPENIKYTITRTTQVVVHTSDGPETALRHGVAVLDGGERSQYDSRDNLIFADPPEHIYWEVKPSTPVRFT